ncbi:MAG: VWA domain-containing protein [Gemmatimonadetes bacterium]|nr:VWA domain-containing protein [Gemmatimonadota bacterium]
MTFDAPVVLLLAPLIGGAVWFGAAWARRARLRRAAQWSDETLAVARAAGRWGSTTLSLSAFLGALALAGPRWGEERIVAETRGLNLVVAVDISRSMLAEDVAPSRLGRALREARRLIQDLDGDRLGLVGFAGASYVLSPLSIDGSALTLYLDALDPDIASEGGTNLAAALVQGGELLRASPELADRVLVVFTDGEAHDSLPLVLARAQPFNALGIHLIVVAEGGRVPARIPVRDEHGILRGWQQDEAGDVITTARRDDILAAIADAAQGTIVASELPDQAGAVRDLVAAYKRSAATEARTERGRPRAWIPLVAAAMILLGQAWSRRTAALVSLALLVVAGRPAVAQSAGLSAPASRPRTEAQKAWDAGDMRRAAEAYLAELAARRRDDTAWFNAGTAALAAGDLDVARSSLARAATALDPEVRFRALYNLGLVALHAATADSANRDSHLGDAERAYREALLLKPHHFPAKWNLELALRQRRSGSGQSNMPPAGGGGVVGVPPGGGKAGGGTAAEEQGREGLSRAQAEQILQSIGQEELRTRRERMGRTRHAAPPTVKDW